CFRGQSHMARVSGHRVAHRWIGRALTPVMVACLVCVAAPAVAVAQVTAFPGPGTRFAVPTAQITFRGAAPAEIGAVRVTGSKSGVHTGMLKADPDGRGATFVATEPFAAGESVTVTTGLDVRGASGGTFRFTVTHPAAPLAPGKLPRVVAGHGQLQHFRSRQDLVPPAVAVRGRAPAGEGDIFVAPQFGPAENGPMILGPHGDLIWFRPTPIGRNMLSTDFRVQDLHGKPVLTWWQWGMNHGHGIGEGVILDENYHQLAVVHAGNGLKMDLHEFLVTPQGEAYIIATSPVWLRGHARPVIDDVIQGIDIQSGLTLFQWHSLDHIKLDESYVFGPKQPGHVLDPCHLNSISLDRDGNLIVSARNTSAVYKIDHATGKVLWRLGGKRSNFTMGPGTRTAFQHDAVAQSDGTITLFDDGAGPPRVEPFSQARRVSLNFATMTATLVKSYGHSPALSANFEGSAQVLQNGDVFLGWGQRQFFSEDNAAGDQVFDARFEAPTSSYRAYRSVWHGRPTTRPALSLSTGAHNAVFTHESWNGATEVSGWRVLSGPTPTSLARTRSARKFKFESTIVIHNRARYVAVQALGANGAVLATSEAVAVPGR
ncbi:MAG: arylsulfotransferase family protein, partial [Solirubrobacteraceae bacterium]